MQVAKLRPQSTSTWHRWTKIAKQMRRQMQQFAPLKSDNASQDDLPQLQGIVFDMDGTLCEYDGYAGNHTRLTWPFEEGKPQNYMFGEMRRALNIPKTVDIIDHIDSLPQDEQASAWAKIEAIERDAMEKQESQPGLVRLLEYLDRRGVRRAICTRNFDKPVAHLLEHHVPGHITPFSPILTRSFKPPKPSPAGILHIAKDWGVEVVNRGTDKAYLPLLMVGDSIDDITAGRDAGTMTVLLASEGKEDLQGDPKTDVVIENLDDLIDLLERGLRGRFADALSSTTS